MTKEIECCNQDCNQGRTCPLRTGAAKTTDPAQRKRREMPTDCYCSPGQCMAPKIMGVQYPCLDHAKRDANKEGKTK